MTALVLVSDHLPDSGWEILNNAPHIRAEGPFQSRKALLEAIPKADALIVRSATQVDRQLLEQGKRLKVVARAGARLDNIDIETATRRGVMVINVPEANIFAVVEHAFALLLALARQIPTGYNEVRAGNWPRHAMMGIQLYGKTVGIVGFGRLGRAASERARAFGMDTLVYDPFIDLSFAREQGVQIVDFEELLVRSDVVLPMTTYNARTRHIFNASAFARMKTGTLFVNVVHAGLVDSAALAEALDEGRPAWAGVDVFAQEPPPADDPLARHPRVLSVPHLNQNTVESQAQSGVQVATAVISALASEDYQNVVNLPFNRTVSYRKVRSYMKLASKLGKLQGQLADGWITHVEVEVLGEGIQDLVRPATAALLAGMLKPVDGRAPNWVSGPMLAHDQGIRTSQARGVLEQGDYPNLLACRIRWEGGGVRTVGGVLFANGDARLVRYDNFHIDAHPEGFVLIIENQDVAGIIGRVGTLLGDAGINIANWRYGRETRGGQAVSFINVDSFVPRDLLAEIEQHADISAARLVRL